MSDATAMPPALSPSSHAEGEIDDDVSPATSQGVINPDDLVPGRIVDGRFELLDVLGEGGWATVYLARQLHVEREVALKILTLRSDEHHDAFVERFRREAAAAARIRHPNIITVHDVGTLGLNRCPYIVMDLLDGRDLADALTTEGPMELERALRLLLPVIDAMAQAHEADIIHRDLKPSNLFLIHPGTAAERLVVVDFGIARIGRSVSRLTEGSSIFGTPAYLAPEWIEHRTATPAMDVYQLGLILVEALTGAPVVQDAVLYQCLQRHVDGTLELPDDVMATALGPVLRRALHRDVERRYADCGELLRALLGVLDALAVDAEALRQVATPGLDAPRGLFGIDDVDDDDDDLLTEDAAPHGASRPSTAPLADTGAPLALLSGTERRADALATPGGGIVLDMHIDLDDDDDDDDERVPEGVAAFARMTPPPTTPLRSTPSRWGTPVRVLAPLAAALATIAFVWLWSPATPFEGGEANAQPASSQAGAAQGTSATARPAFVDGASLAPRPDPAPVVTPSFEAMFLASSQAAAQGVRGVLAAPNTPQPDHALADDAVPASVHIDSHDTTRSRAVHKRRATPTPAADKPRRARRPSLRIVP